MKTSTWNLILEAVEALPFSSAEEIAWQAEVSPSTARKYLAEMFRRGEVKRQIDLRESEMRFGRTRLVPTRIYSPKEESND